MSEWPNINDLPWIYSHKIIIKDLQDSKKLSSSILHLFNSVIDEKQINFFYKWLKLIIDNMEKHFLYKHIYYFPILKYPICNELLEDYKKIKEVIKDITYHLRLLYPYLSKIIKEKKNIQNYISFISVDISQLLFLLQTHFTKEKQKLIPKMMKEKDYSIIRKLDIKIGLRSKLYALPHLYRNLKKEEYQQHMNNILMIPKITQKTTVILNFNRYKKKYDPIIEYLFPKI